MHKNKKPNNNNPPRPNKWVITRRDVLKASGVFIAGLTMQTPLSYAQDTQRKPIIQFGMVTDMHYADADPRGTRYYRESLPKLTECVTFMNDQKVAFLIELGDLKDEDPRAQEKDTLTYLETIEAILAKFEGPRYHVLGNHDMDSISKQQFLDRVTNTGIDKSANYYSFDQNDIHFVVLDACYTSNGVDYDHGNFSWKDANIPQEQATWLKNDLTKTAHPTIVFVHQQLDGETSHCIKNAAEIRDILEENQNVLAVFHGHNHAGHYSHMEGIHYYTLKAVIEGSGAENNAYATATVYDDHSIVITGYRNAESMNLT